MKRYLVFAFPLLLGACAQFQPGGYEFCKGTPYACNNDESAAKSAPGGNPAPAAAKPAEPPKVDPPKPDPKPPGGGKPGDKPGHGDKNHDHRGPRDGNPNDREQQGHSETGKRDSDQR